jgi:hypothetical protein
LAGVISGTTGTPATTYNFRVRLTDTIGFTEKDLTIFSNGAPVILTGTTVAGAFSPHIHPHPIAGFATGLQFKARGDTPITWEMGGVFEDVNLTMDSSGLLTGSPNAVRGANATFVIVTATNGIGVANKTFDGVVDGPPSFAISVSPAYAFPTNFSRTKPTTQVIQFENLERLDGQVIVGAILSGSMPPGLSLDVQPGTTPAGLFKRFTGTPTTNGSYPITFRFQNSFGIFDYPTTLVVSEPPAMVLGDPPNNTAPNFNKAFSKSYQISITGGIGDPRNYTYEILNAPANIVVVAPSSILADGNARWTMQGTQAVSTPSGNYIVTVRVTDEASNIVERDYVIQLFG